MIFRVGGEGEISLLVAAPSFGGEKEKRHHKKDWTLEAPSTFFLLRDSMSPRTCRTE